MDDDELLDEACESGPLWVQVEAVDDAAEVAMATSSSSRPLVFLG